MSWQTYTMVAGAIVLGLIFILVESRAAEPIIPLRLFRNRTITLSSLASLFVGVAMFTGTVFFAQYFQLARDKSPTMSGVLTIPMIGGLFVSSTVSGQVITKTGKWKAWLVSGGVLVTAGLGLLGTIRYDTAYWKMAVFMALMGLGIGMMMQNLVLSTQNQVEPQDLGSASSTVTFFRSLGGAMGVSALGAIMAHRITDYVRDGLDDLSPKYARLAAKAGSDGAIPDLGKLPKPLRTVIESAYGHAIADVFLIAACLAFLALVITLFIKEVPLRTRGGLAQAAAARPRRKRPRGRGRGCRARRGGGPELGGVEHRGRSRWRTEAVRGRHAGPAHVRRRGRWRTGPRLRPRSRERPGRAGRRHTDLPRGPAARPVGRRCRRFLRRGRAGLRQLRPDRLRRRLPAAGLDGRRARGAGVVRHPAQRYQRPERCRAGRRDRAPGQGRDGHRHGRPR